MSVFLCAEWRKLAMANYAVDPALLVRFLPRGTELDLWNNTCYVSLVGFLFLNTRLKGVRIPFHTNFEEVNLRFYVKYLHSDGWRRGVVFIKEFVPKPALTFVANSFYKENYQTVAMDHSHNYSSITSESTIEYRWKYKTWNSIRANASSVPQDIVIGSEAEFITEHYWGYTKISSTQTSEYAVEHPRWQIYPVKYWDIDVNFGALYGPDFDFLKSQKPVSVFLAEGSEIIVRKATAIRAS